MTATGALAFVLALALRASAPELPNRIPVETIQLEVGIKCFDGSRILVLSGAGTGKYMNYGDERQFAISPLVVADYAAEAVEGGLLSYPEVVESDLYHVSERGDLERVDVEFTDICEFEMEISAAEVKKTVVFQNRRFAPRPLIEKFHRIVEMVEES